MSITTHYSHVHVFWITKESYQPVLDFSQANVKRRAVLKLLRAQSGIYASFDVLSHLFLTEKVIKDVFTTSNVQINRILLPNIIQSPISTADVFRFSAIFYYLGAVCLQ